MEAAARGLALEVGPLEIMVDVVSPGIVETAVLDNFPNEGQLPEVAKVQTPDWAPHRTRRCRHGGHLPSPDPGGWTISWQTIDVDGGYLIMA